MRGQLVGGGDFPQAFRQQLHNLVRRIWSKLVLSSSPNCLVSLCAVPQKILICIPEKGTTAEFWKPPKSTVARVIGPFSKWLLAWTHRQFVKGFSLFSLYYVEAPSTPHRTTCRGQPCFKVSCKFSEWPASRPLPPLSPRVYRRSNCPAVSAKRQILAARRCLPSSGDHLAPQCLLLRAAPVPPPPAGSAIRLGSVQHGLSSTKLNSCIFIIVEGT